MQPAALGTLLVALSDETDDLAEQRKRLRAAWGALPSDVRAQWEADLACAARRGTIDALVTARAILAKVESVCGECAKLNARVSALERHVFPLMDAG